MLFFPSEFVSGKVEEERRDAHARGHKVGQRGAAVENEVELDRPHVPGDDSALVGETVFAGQVGGEDDLAALGHDVGVGGEVDDGLAGELE